MAQSVIGALRVNLGLDSAQFDRGAQRAGNRLGTMRTQFLAVAGVAAAMGTAIAMAALRGAQQIDEAAKAARRLDSSIGGFRALELAASEAGVSLSSLTNDIQTMNREIASIGVSGNGQRALDALGLTVADLADLDADEKLAVISDAVAALGLSSAQTTAILRDLGVRNREMVLLVSGGGDAIRNARSDIQAYGLEISNVDASMIEQANDRIGRLGLITQYAGQQLAIALVPALGAMAHAMTEGLREGGFLRGAIDALVGSMGFLASAVGVIVLALGTRYVVALGVATFTTFTLTGAMAAATRAATFMWAALGGPVGVAVAIAASLMQIVRGNREIRDTATLATQAHGLYETAIRGVFEAQGLSAAGEYVEDLREQKMAAIAAARAELALLEARMAVAANTDPDAYLLLGGQQDELVRTISLLRAELAGLASAAAEVSPALAPVVPVIEDAAEGLDTAQVRAALFAQAVGSINFSTALTGARQLSAELGITLNAAMRIRGLLGAAAQAANTPVEFDPRSPRFNAAAAEEAARLERIRATMDLIQQETRAVGLGLASIAGTGGGGGGGGGGGSAREAAEAIAEIEPAIEETSSAMESFRSTAQSAFVGLVTGAKTLKETLSDLLGKFAEFLANSAFQSIFSGGGGGGKGGGGGGFLSSIFAGFFDKGGNIPRGQFGIAGERGMELVQGPAHVTSRADTARMMGGGGGVVGNVDARGAQQGVAEQITQGISRAIPEITAAVRSGINGRQSRGYSV